MKLMNDFLDAKNEPLDSELLAYCRTLSKSNMAVLQHPLVYAVPYFTQMNAIYNNAFNVKKKAIEEALRERNYALYLIMYERPYRISAFERIQEQLADAEYWQHLGDLWCDTENVWQNKTLWMQCLHSPRGSRENIMRSQEQKELEDLPDIVMIYRGARNERQSGLSWTTDKDIAEWYAKRFDLKAGIVQQREISKRSVFAYFTRRNESEIVLLPGFTS